MTTYKVLIPCQNDETGKSYKAGATVTDEDFPKGVITNWLKLDPPVLEEIKGKKAAVSATKDNEDNDNGS